MKKGPIVAAGVALAVLAASQLFDGAMPLGVVLLGALLGTGTGLMAVGLVLTYRTTRIINFSYGAMGSVGAGVAASAIGMDKHFIPIGTMLWICRHAKRCGHFDFMLIVRQAHRLTFRTNFFGSSAQRG